MLSRLNSLWRSPPTAALAPLPKRMLALEFVQQHKTKAADAQHQQALLAADIRVKQQSFVVHGLGWLFVRGAIFSVVSYVTSSSLLGTLGASLSAWMKANAANDEDAKHCWSLQREQQRKFAEAQVHRELEIIAKEINYAHSPTLAAPVVRDKGDGVPAFWQPIAHHLDVDRRRLTYLSARLTAQTAQLKRAQLGQGPTHVNGVRDAVTGASAVGLLLAGAAIGRGTVLGILCGLTLGAVAFGIWHLRHAFDPLRDVESDQAKAARYAKVRLDLYQQAAHEVREQLDKQVPEAFDLWHRALASTPT